jgi:hypothetical protein
MSGITAIHHPLRHVDSYAGDIAPIVHIGDFIYRPAIDAHSKMELRMVFELATNLLGAAHRRIRSREKRQRHPIAGCQPHQFLSCLRAFKLLRLANDLVK